MIFLICAFQLLAQVSIKKMIFENKNVDGKMLEIWHNNSVTPIPVVLVWLREDEQQGQQFLTINPGKNMVILSSNPLWNGHIKGLGSTDPNITANLIDVTFVHQVLEFFKPFNLTPGSINFAPANYLFGHPVRFILLATTVLFSFLGLIFKMNWRQAFYLGFVCSGFLLLTQQVYQEYSIMNTYKINNESLQPFTSLSSFIKSATPIIEGHPWSKTKLSGVLNSYVKYQFAEEEFTPLNAASKNNLLITDKPNKNEVVLNTNGFYITR